MIITFVLFIPIIKVNATELNEIKSNNVILYNLNDDSILYEKNSEDKVLIASMTKIMTAIVSIEHIDNLDEKLILTNDIFSSLTNDLSFAGFKPNEEITYRDLLYGALLPSGADATHSLAIFISGSEEEFVKLMNEKAKEIGMINTNFTNTIGIEDNNNMHYSTVKDVALLLKYSLKNKEFKKIFTTEKYTTSDNLLNFKSTKLKMSEKNGIDLSFIKGSKTGYTSKAGLCLASIANYNNVNYLLVTAGADYKTNKINHFLDAKNIYEYYFTNYGYKKILKKDQVLKKIKTKYKEDVNIIQNKNIELYLKNDIKNKIQNAEEKKEKYIMLRNSIKEDLKEKFISEEEYWQYNNEYSEKIKKLKQDIELFEKEREKETEKSNNVEWMNIFKNYEKINELNRLLVDELIEDIVISEDGNLKVIFKYEDKYFEALDFINKQKCDIMLTS